MTREQREFYEDLTRDGPWCPGHPIPERLKDAEGNPDTRTVRVSKPDEKWWEGEFSDWKRPTTGPLVGLTPEAFDPCPACRQ